MSTTQPVKVTVNLGSEVVSELRRMAACRNTTITEILRQAIGNELFFTRQRNAGNRILIKRADGSWRQVLGY